MARLYLHIGVGRTGTSALQRWFAENSDALERQALHYFEIPSVARARRGEVTSGNGTALFAYLAPERGRRAFVAGRLRKTVTAYCSGMNGLASSEMLANLEAWEWERLAAAAEGIDLRFIAIVRDPVDSLWSGYCRHRSTGIEAGSFAEFFNKPVGGYRSAGALREALQVFPPHRFAVFHYEQHRDRLDRTMCAALQIDLPPMSRDRMNVNGFDGTPSRRDIAHLAKREAENIDWLNRRFFNGRDVVKPISDRLAAQL